MFTPVRPARASNDIVHQIKTQIFAGHLAAGNWLPSENDLYEQFGVSRTTVRDALRVLESQGLIDIKVGAGGGAFVAEPRHGTVSESLSNMLKLQNVDIDAFAERRLIIETSIVALAAKRATAKDIAAMEEAIAQARAGRKSGDPHVTPHSVSLHVARAEAAKNQVLLFTVNSFRSVFYETLEKLLPAPDMQERAIEDHQKILDAIQARDAEQAQRIMRTHLSYFKARAARLSSPSPAATETKNDHRSRVRRAHPRENNRSKNGE